MFKRACSRQLEAQLNTLQKDGPAAWADLPEEELFTIQEVAVEVPDCDMPGRPLRRVQCATCGDWVQDCREVLQDNAMLCRACAGQRYYQVLGKQ